MTVSGGGDSYSQGLIIGFRMVQVRCALLARNPHPRLTALLPLSQVGIGITVGLLGSGLCVYAIGTQKGASRISAACALLSDAQCLSLLQGAALFAF